MIEEVDYKGWKSYRLGTEEVELVIPCEIGPRIVRAALGRGGENLFAEVAEESGGCGEAEWCIRGGHRLWHSPEHPVRTYVPDNTEVKTLVGKHGDSLQVTQAEEPGTGIVKHLYIEIVNAKTVKVTHRLLNNGLWPVDCAAWALSVMRRGGYAVFPLSAKGSHPEDLLPGYALVPWTYTDLSLPVWDVRNGRIGVATEHADKPQKLGVTRYPGWMAYWQEAGTFVKFHAVKTGHVYPDMGCVMEVFACDWMIELESLSPLMRLGPGEFVEHIEYWGFFAGLRKPDTDEVFFDELVPTVAGWMSATPA